MDSARFVFLCIAATSCAHGVVALSTAVPVASTAPVPIEVTSRSAGVSSPVPLKGSGVVYAAIEESLGHIVTAEVLPWAESKRAIEPRGWQLIVDLWRATAHRHDGAITVALDVRATLRTRQGNRYIAQTQAHCKQTALAEPADAAPVFYACMSSIGKELGGWLGGVQP
jgi:hypothetical protein